MSIRLDHKIVVDGSIWESPLNSICILLSFEFIRLFTIIQIVSNVDEVPVYLLLLLVYSELLLVAINGTISRYEVNSWWPDHCTTANDELRSTKLDICHWRHHERHGLVIVVVTSPMHIWIHLLGEWSYANQLGSTLLSLSVSASCFRSNRHTHCCLLCNNDRRLLLLILVTPPRWLNNRRG